MHSGVRTTSWCSLDLQNVCVLSKARQAEGGREAEVTGAGAKARARVREGKAGAASNCTAAPGASAPTCGGTLHIVTRLFVTGFILQWGGARPAVPDTARTPDRCSVSNALAASRAGRCWGTGLAAAPPQLAEAGVIEHRSLLTRTGACLSACAPAVAGRGGPAGACPFP